jgi:hypothetical protein
MRVFFVIPILLSAQPALAQVTPVERTYGERVAMRALDQRCNLFDSGPRRALGGFTAQAHGAALRAGASLSHLNLIAMIPKFKPRPPALSQLTRAGAHK